MNVQLVLLVNIPQEAVFSSIFQCLAELCLFYSFFIFVQYFVLMFKSGDSVSVCFFFSSSDIIAFQFIGIVSTLFSPSTSPQFSSREFFFGWWWFCMCVLRCRHSFDKQIIYSDHVYLVALNLNFTVICFHSALCCNAKIYGALVYMPFHCNSFELHFFFVLRFRSRLSPFSYSDLFRRRVFFVYCCCSFSFKFARLSIR